jgi:RNA 2',3'-cyclic 3'-phosphodiesterase
LSIPLKGDGPLATRRLFFALGPDAEVGDRIEDLQRRLRERADGRWVARGDIHLTISFLGNVTADHVDGLCRLPGCAQGLFELSLHQIAFRQRGGVVCINPDSVPEPLLRLVESLQSILDARRFRTDRRPFQPHVTLGRKVRAGWEIPRLATPILWSVRSYALFESELSRSGARYTVLRTWALDG